MSPLNHKSLAECGTQDLYCAWKGQLLIQEQQLCEIILQSPCSSSIPAQLPAKIDFRHVVAISELRKKFPEAAFKRSSYTDHEVSYQDILFCLYEVEMLNQDGPKLEQLIEHLKEKDLALIKYLNHQRVLFLLSTTALVEEKEPSPEGLAHLQALLLISSPGPKRITAKDLRCKHGEKTPAQVALVLPSLCHALLQAAKNQGKGRAPPDALVKQHIQEYTRQPETLHPDPESPSSLPSSFESDPAALPEKCPPSCYSHLQSYLRHPQNFALEISTALACLDGSCPSPPSDGMQAADASPGSNLDPSPPEDPVDVVETSSRPQRAALSSSGSGDAAPKLSPPVDRPPQRCKRRSSRLLGASARKKWSPLKALCLMENSKKRKKNAKRKSAPPRPLKRDLFLPPLGENLRQATEFNEPTLKLKNLQNPLRKKRGAEVLSAEFVQETRSESAAKAVFPPDGRDPSEKKPRLLSCRKDGEIPKSPEQAEIRRPVTRRSTQQSAQEPAPGSQAETGHENDKPWGVGTAAQDIFSAHQRDECDSHALNMLADLALSSCNSPLLRNGSPSPSAVAASPSREPLCAPKEALSGKASDHEYHRATKSWRGGLLADGTCRRSLSPPERGALVPERPSGSQEGEPRTLPRRRRAEPAGAKSPAVSPKGAGELAEPGMHLLISLEHSYASLASEGFPRKGSPPGLDSRNGVKHAKAGPLVLPGKVLPFRHQQHLCPPHPQLKSYAPFLRSMARRTMKDDFSRFRQVTFCDRTVKVTFRWEADYRFSLDSKYTSHPLEKTVSRAVHGAWDADLPNSVEDMKLIIHMWVALFYSKPLKSPLSRTVVEHSNPAKYVSLPTTVDPFEFADDSEGPCGLEKCPADSLSEGPQTPGEAEEGAPSPSEKPLSCNELSSTNSIEDAPSPVPSDEPSPLPAKEDRLPGARSDAQEASPSLAQEAEKGFDEKIVPGPLVSENSPDRNSSGGQSDGDAPFVADVEAEDKKAVNVVEVSQSDAAPIPAGLPENPAGERSVAGTVAPPVVVSQEINSPSPSPEGNSPSPSSEEKRGGAELVHPSAAEWTKEANAVSQAEGSPCRDTREPSGLPRDEEDVSEESMEWESIDLALSDSNDTDVEPQDADLDQDGEEGLEETGVAEEREEDMPSPNDSLPMSPASLPESTGAREASPLSASTSASLGPVDLVEGSCLLREGREDSSVGSPQASSPQHDGEAEPTDIEDGSEHSVWPKEAAVDENLVIPEEDQGIGLMDATPKQPELFPIQKDAAAEGELVKSKDSLTPVENPLRPDPGGEETPGLEETDGEFKKDFEATKCCVEEEKIGASGATQETAPGGETSRSAGTEPEGPGSLSCALTDTPSTKESTGLTWISSVHLESVTPPESDEEGPARDLLPPANTKWVVSEYLQQCSVRADHRGAAAEAQEPSLPAPHKDVTCHQREVSEREALPENEATSTPVEIMPCSPCTFWEEGSRRSPECTLTSALSSQEDKSLDESSTSELCEVDLEQASHEASMPEEEDQDQDQDHTGEESLEILPTEGHSEDSSEDSSEDVDSLPPEDPRESQEDLEDACSSEREPFPNRVARTALRWEGESSSVDGSHEVAEDAHHSKSEGLLCPPPAAIPGEAEAACCVDDSNLHQGISESGGRVHPEGKQRRPGAAAEATKHGGPFPPDEGGDRPGAPPLEKRRTLGPLQDYVNFSVTKKHKEGARTFRSSQQRGCRAREPGPTPPWSSRAWRPWGDPVQNTLDVECLRFHYKVKQILRRAQRSASVAALTNEFSPEVPADTLPLKGVPEGPAFSPPPRCRSPLLVTVRNPGSEPSPAHRYPRGPWPPDYSGALPLPHFASRKESRSRAARCTHPPGRGPPAPFHLNKLTYENKLQDFRGEISVIMDEFAELSRVIALGDRPPGRQGRDPPTTSGGAPEPRCPPLPRRTASYEHLLTELCNTLHLRLRNVVQEACKKPFTFYLVETADDPFFGRLKSLLKKGGHTETEPLQFCKTSHGEADRLMVIIRNEDIFPHIHKVPCLLRLKRLPSVTFAGVDSPDDVLDHTYQELFHRGGFVVSEDQMLEAMAVGDLKNMLKTLEKLQDHGRWRWLLHYKEVKQLREKARVDPAAHAKQSLLKSCQGANLTEVLHYHQCDSRSTPKSEHLNCVLNLQVQHISARFAVFLTEKPSASRAALEAKGILALDVKAFLEMAEGMGGLA